MNLASFVGLRYLRAKKSTAFLSLITFFSVAGVALGVATLIVTLSVMDGFEGVLKDRLATGEYHVLVTRTAAAGEPYFPFTVEDSARYFAASSDIQSVSPVLSTEAILRSKKRVAGVTLRGISEAQMNSTAQMLVEASEGMPDKKRPKTLSEDGLWIGRELSFQIGVLPGDKVQVISPTETEGPLESVSRMQTFTVEGIYESGLPDKDIHVAYAPVRAVQDFLRKPGVINSVELKVRDFNNSTPAAEALRATLGSEFLVKDWNELNAHLFASLRLERITMFVILTMIIFVASFNIVTSLRMNVIEKRKELSILQAMGATRQQIGRVFLVQGAVIGIVGTLLGVIIGLGICILLKHYDFIQLPDIFYDRSLPVKIAPLYVLGIAFTALIIVLFAAFSPARAASRITPLEGIREL